MTKIKRETYEQKKRRLFGKQFLDVHLKELRALLNTEVNKSDLLSITETDEIMSKSKERFNNSYLDSYKVKILFSDKESLLIFIGSLINLKDGKAHIATEYCLDCGLLEINSLTDFNINFERERATSELFTIILSDLSNKLLLDIEEEKGRYYLEIETYGKDWPKARLPSPSSAKSPDFE